MRVRENAESIAFYQGEAAERGALVVRLRSAVDNFGELLKATRSVDFFTSFYRYMVTLPAAVVAPLYFRGEIEFGVINQSSSAFSHILGDVSLVVYQIERLASFSAVTDRLGQMTEVLEKPAASIMFGDEDEDGETKLRSRPRAGPSRGATARRRGRGARHRRGRAESWDPRIVFVSGKRRGIQRETRGARGATSVRAGPDRARARPLGARAAAGRGPGPGLAPGGSLLVMGPSGAGKTSLLRAVAGLWEQGRGEVRWTVEEDGEENASISKTKIEKPEAPSLRFRPPPTPRQTPRPRTPGCTSSRSARTWCSARCGSSSCTRPGSRASRRISKTPPRTTGGAASPGAPEAERRDARSDAGAG